MFNIFFTLNSMIRFIPIRLKFNIIKYLRRKWKPRFLVIIDEKVKFKVLLIHFTNNRKYFYSKNIFFNSSLFPIYFICCPFPPKSSFINQKSIYKSKKLLNSELFQRLFFLSNKG